MAKSSVLGVQIPPNQALSGAIDLGSHGLVAIEMPEGWAGTVITFQCKAERSATSAESTEDWDDVYDSGGTEVNWTVAANRVVTPTAAHAAAIAPLRFIRIRSGTAAAPTNQNPARELRLIVKEGQ